MTGLEILVVVGVFFFGAWVGSLSGPKPMPPSPQVEAAREKRCPSCFRSVRPEDLRTIRTVLAAGLMATRRDGTRRTPNVVEKVVCANCVSTRVRPESKPYQRWICLGHPLRGPFKYYGRGDKAEAHVNTAAGDPTWLWTVVLAPGVEQKCDTAGSAAKLEDALDQAQAAVELHDPLRGPPA